MEQVPGCIVCDCRTQERRFEKASGSGELFTLVRCPSCGLEFVSPRPTPEEIAPYYGIDYFARRTDRGYNDYFSPAVRREIERVFELNLRDLGFFGYEALDRERRALDIGCAAGYFVEYLHNRGWDSGGIDVAPDCVRSAQERGLQVRHGDYLAQEFEKPFSLITLWASIEHLHHPDRFLEKIHRDLGEGGVLYISTCRTGGWNFMRLFGEKWRFYNFPEHLYFFSASCLRKLLERKGFDVIRYQTYGSGVGKTGSLVKRIADFLAKRFFLGDMMIIGARKK